MNGKIILLAVLLLPLPAWSLSPVTDTDLSDVSSPASLIIRPVQTTDNGAEQDTQVDPESKKDTVANIQKLETDSIKDKDISTGIIAEDTNDTPKIGVPTAGKTYSMEYPEGSKNTSNDSYKYIIKSGDIEMRDTYINRRNSTVIPGSWVDIKPR